ncbi:MAG: methionine--tRNA ligase, partial [Planctomycetota bacterium]
VCADVIARYARLLGWDVFFVTGTDEHSINVERKAYESGIEPQEYCDKMADEYRRMWQKLGISYNYFIRTTQPEHEKAVLEIFRRLREKNLVYKALYKGLYCASCESYVKQSDLVDNRCPTHKIEPIILEEENYFFRLSAFKSCLKQIFKEREEFLLPGFRKNEMLSILEGELEDISISRTTFKFGIKIPDDPSHVIYVWIDALINYLTACGFPDNTERFNYLWPADIHIMAKDIVRFHTIIWPAILLGADLEIPRSVFAHGFLNFSGGKMSKTLGNVVSPEYLLTKFGIDPLRFYFIKESPFGEDFDFSETNLLIRYNNELANEWGNLIQRLSIMNKNYCRLVIKKENFALPQHILSALLQIYNSLEYNIVHCNLFEIIHQIWDVVKKINRFLDETAPWKLQKTDKIRAIQIIDTMLIVCIYLNHLLSPILLDTFNKIEKTLCKNISRPNHLQSFQHFLEKLPPSFNIEIPPILFPKI